MSEVVYGCKAINFGEAADTGVMPVLLTKLFDTYRDSVSFVEEEADSTPEYSDQADDPFIVLSAKGAKTLKGSTFDWTPSILKELKGGTVLNGMWVEPAIAPVIYKAVELETDSGVKVQCSKWQVTAKLNMEIKKKNVALLEFTLKPLLPVKIGRPT